MPAPGTTPAAANEAAATVTASPRNPLRPTLVDLTLSENPSQELHNALLANGFVAVRNCGVSTELLAEVFQSAHAFFAQPGAAKDAVRYRDTQENFGYQPQLSEALDPHQAADAKETFTMRNLIGTANSVDSPPGFGVIANRMFTACSESAMRIIDLLEQALGARPGAVTVNHTGENMTLRYLHYPVLSTGNPGGASADQPTDAPKAAASADAATQNAPKVKKPVQLGAGAHTDYGTITLLFSDGVAGLQLCDSAGDWRDVDVAAGDVLVNTGDLMALWSNGLYPSTLHRVQPRLSQPARYSLAFFVDPDSATRVSPLPCCVTTERPATAEEVVAGEHIQARIEASQR